jgi:two-component system phosphate regulon sensor histidine kinase PhoR
MKRHSFFVRLFVGNLVIVVVAVVVAAAVSYRAVNAQHRRISNAYQDNLTLIAAQYLEDLWPLPPEAVDRLCKDFLQPGGDTPAAVAPTLEPAVRARLTIIARDGRVLGDSDGDPDRMENHRTDDRPEIMAALADRPGSDVRRSETLGTRFRYVARPIHHEGAVVGVARVATPVLAILESQAVLREGILWGSLVAIAAFALIGVLINWLWYSPLRGITQAARQIASGDLSERVTVRGSAELVELGHALNAMRDSLARQIETVSAQRANLEQVVANLREGVVATDDQGRIVLMNRAARNLLARQGDEVIGAHIQNVVRVADIVDAFNEAAAGKTARCQVETEVGHDRRHLDVHASRLAPTPAGDIGCLVVVRDVTDLVRTAAMKAEFVANASHELRTPLATLRAAVEAIEEEQATGPLNAEAFERTLAILRRNVDRLESLTLDLLDLHAVETAKRGGREDEIGIAALCQWAENQFGDAAASKGVALECTAADPERVFVADRKLMELILQNLLDNAIKFTDSGGRVTLSAEGEDGRVLFRVVDTGCGIARGEQSRIFERFYQSDVSRSGDTKSRGTGLGLAIVKHAVERLGGSVSLQSEPGKGTSVSVFVPDRSQERHG